MSRHLSVKYVISLYFTNEIEAFQFLEIRLSINSEFKQRRFWATHENRKGAFFSFNKPWRYQIFIVKIAAQDCKKSPSGSRASLKNVACLSSLVPRWTNLVPRASPIFVAKSPGEELHLPSSTSRDIPKSDILSESSLPIKQFLAAKSRWIQFLLSKYSIPEAASTLNLIRFLVFRWAPFLRR